MYFPFSQVLRVRIQYGKQRFIQWIYFFLQAERWQKRWGCHISRQVCSLFSASMRFSKMLSGQRCAPAGRSGFGWQTSEEFSNQLSRYAGYENVHSFFENQFEIFQRFSRIWLCKEQEHIVDINIYIPKIKKWRQFLGIRQILVSMPICFFVCQFDSSWDNLEHLPTF